MRELQDMAAQLPEMDGIRVTLLGCSHNQVCLGHCTCWFPAAGPEPRRPLDID